MENGDIVTACSDGIVRIWTVNQDFFADQLELDLYTSQLSQYKSSRYNFLLSVIMYLLLPSHQLLLFVYIVNFLTFQSEKYGSFILGEYLISFSEELLLNVK
jgi:hypothetical protein